MKSILTSTFILLNLISFSQNKLTLIIDTVDFVDEMDFLDFRVFITNQGFGNFGEHDTSGQISLTTYPNFTSEIVVESENTTIQIPIGNSSGYLEIINPYELDTIRISYLKQYGNCYKDTSKTRIEYYRVINDSVSDHAYKVKYKKETEKKKCKRKPPLETTLTINDQKYYVSIEKRKSDATKVMNGHGYKPKQTEKNHDNYSGTYFHISSITERYINVISVKLDK